MQHNFNSTTAQNSHAIPYPTHPQSTLDNRPPPLALSNALNHLPHPQQYKRTQLIVQSVICHAHLR
ncbi:hypothetical protein N658DRAFT_106261 [Parathielavia hyrcaniae]|uniref:Uncharacterized protein n=1 Tax=Parathielavia hyrcaniae TaxID=113614 RepID=A0AAN6T158_9PEZI|nr:hypothetical protein N658DRAFT_106261 [Parathielavia hyrcaniae]